MEVVVLGGHMIVGLRQKRNSTTRAGHVVPYRDGVGWPCPCMYVSNRSLSSRQSRTCSI